MSVLNLPTYEGAGGYWGSGPGFDIGDIFGPNSALANLFGIPGSPGVPTPAPVPAPQYQPGAPRPMPTAAPGPVDVAAACDLSAPFHTTSCGNAVSQPHVRCNPRSGKVEWFVPAKPTGFRMKGSGRRRRRGCR